MSDCEMCVFRTSIKKESGSSRYSGLQDSMVWFSDEKVVPACGKAPGLPLEIPVDRIPCSDLKRKNDA